MNLIVLMQLNKKTNYQNFQALAIWISKALISNRTITGEIIIVKTNDFAKINEY